MFPAFRRLEGLAQRLIAQEDQYNGRTPLSWAAEQGHQGIAQLLVEASKADAHAKDKYDRTPLFWAAKNGHKGILKLLVETGKVNSGAKDKNGRTPFSLAAENGRRGIPWIVWPICMQGIDLACNRDAGMRT